MRFPRQDPHLWMVRHRHTAFFRLACAPRTLCTTTVHSQRKPCQGLRPFDSGELPVGIWRSRGRCDGGHGGWRVTDESAMMAHDPSGEDLVASHRSGAERAEGNRGRSRPVLMAIPEIATEREARRSGRGRPHVRPSSLGFRSTSAVADAVIHSTLHRVVPFAPVYDRLDPQS
jgi:hypothetical protein